MRPTAEEIVKALRCSCTVHEKKVNCTGCPYFYTEKPEPGYEDFPAEFWPQCDCDKIGLDAADLIEEMVK